MLLDFGCFLSLSLSANSRIGWLRLTIKVVLEENGFKVDSFNEPYKALENFTTGLYDLVILDVIMEGLCVSR